ncbi:oligosaccharide flippase family protein [Massilia alkalitolerans]|uniref:oligosaccharide flippase family protein n=1 Tax=Massilia alkalitolerans TaxID=286638 RepID=UPI0028A8A386|nr:oligosaccharide flippase family protein [Massilia alkalitolerans]
MADMRRSLLITFCSSSGSTAVHFVVSLVLARLLSPHDIGVFSMTVVLVNIAHMFRDFGVTTYVQREPELTVAKMRSASGVMFVSAWSIALLLFLLSGRLADWFGEAAMEPVMRVLALGFVVIPFGSITQSLLIRELAAERQAWIQLAGTASYCFTCLLLAWMGVGAISLAWANLANILACVLAAIPLRPQGTPWLPSLRHWRDVVRFGAGSLASNCANAVNNSLPDVLLGKLGSASHVGLFSRANSTVSIFSHVAGATINYGAVAWMSRSHHDGRALAPILQRAACLLTGIGWPAFAVTALAGRDLVQTLYGESWLDCVPAMAPLALTAAVALSFHYLPATLAALGRPYLSSQPSLMMIAARIALAAWLFDGTLASFAWAICLATLATAPLMLWMQRRHVGLEAGPFLRALGPSAGVTIICAAGGWLCQALLPPSWPAWARLLMMAPVLFLLWYGALRIVGHGLLEEVHRLGAVLRVRLAGPFKRRGTSL